MESRDQKPDSHGADEPTLARRDNPPSVSVILDSFEQAWQSQSAPDIASFLPSNGSRAQVLSELVLIDLEWRWRRPLANAPTLDPESSTLPDLPRLEDYVACFPELGSPTDLPLEMITAEYRVRRVWGDRPAVDEYLSRFPGHGDALRRRLMEINKQRPVADDTSHRQFDIDSHRSPRHSPPANGAIPAALGRYEILKVLGEGGFALVYLARDTDLDRQVALKVPRLEQFHSGEALDFFIDEARKAAQLDHKGIVRVHDVQREPDRVYIVQQYITGGDLAQHVKTNRLAPRRIAELMIAIAEAVGYAHQQRYTHLDLKPANILLDQEGAPHVADFGLALHESMQKDRAGEVAGTFPYMSPEQVRGETHRLDGRSDIWSLGVILYELLTGSRPFSGGSLHQFAEDIQFRDPRPPRQVDPSVPRELSRICLSCLAKRATDRYQAAADLIDDLRHWLTARTESERKTGSMPEDSPPEGPASVKIIPKGLRSFDASDADFYLELLPGPHDREGLPKRVRFWKTQIEKADPDETFTVGLMYGPSGCGKSSMVKAGLLPRLADEVLPIYIEATAADTEVRLVKALKKHCPELNFDVGLPDLIGQLRASGGSRGRKVLLVLDQFEQWLHAHESEEESQLVAALRQCDGSSVQCIVMVRDDFWMSATRFMQALEVPLIEGHNSAAIDLFDMDHARKVLAAFGRAYGKLPELPTEPSEEQTRFLKHAVDGLAEDGKVICVRLAVFAEMMKGRPWTEESLAEVGGTEGVGVTFLEETFNAKTAAPSHRLHQTAVRAVLKALLPQQGTNIKGQMNSYGELLEVSGYQDQPRDFDSVLGILDGEVRLITPTEPDELTADNTSASTENQARYYQLTHDFLVPSLREWLTRKQQETRRGRAELRLADRASLWNAKPENRHLPSLWEYGNIRLLTHKKNWSQPQRKMMRRAGRIHGIRWGTTLLLTLIIGVTIQWMVYTSRQRTLRSRTSTAVAAMSTARGILVPRAIDDLKELPREMVVAALREQFDSADDIRKPALAYALADFGDVRVKFLVSQVESASSDEVENLVAALGQSESESITALEKAARDAERRKDWRHKTRLAMLMLHLESPSLAQDMCRLRPDPIERTLFIEECSNWHGDLSRLAQLVADSDDGPFRSGVVLAVGSASESDVLVSDKQAWEPVLADWYQSHPDSLTHSASGWMLRKWELNVPEIAASKSPADGTSWHINSIGTTMLTIPAGSFVHRGYDEDNHAIDQTVTLTRPFLLADSEVTRAQFQQFMDDPDCPDAEKPTGWEGADRRHSPTQQHPVQQVSWVDAVLFCNWLSRKERLTSCYERTGQKEKINNREFDVWRRIRAANGYHLPSEAEWEHACRAGTKTAFSHGDDESLLDRYAVYLANHTEVPGSRLPNGWGLFDMHGNVWEWCHDRYGPELVSGNDPMGPETGSARVVRGGSWNNRDRNCRSSNRVGFAPAYRASYLGFRLASVPPSELSKKQGSGAESGSRRADQAEAEP